MTTDKELRMKSRSGIRALVCMALFAVLVIGLSVGLARAQAPAVRPTAIPMIDPPQFPVLDVPTIGWVWTHPTTGSQVVSYTVEWDVNGVVTAITGIPYGDIAGGSFEQPYVSGTVQSIRVAGVDALDVQGVWSLWSEPWQGEHPGAPGQPVISP